MSGQQPTPQQFRELLARFTGMSPSDIERAVKRFNSQRVVRWGDLEREFARRALAARRRSPKQ